MTSDTIPPADFEHNLLERMARLELAIQRLTLLTKVVKEYYDVAEAAMILQRSDYTVRQWANFGRIRATKIAAGRGRCQEWRISVEEIRRYQNFGLLPRNPNGNSTEPSSSTSKEISHGR
jgi:DNA replicative helicase MCM subunit Mcm2 (Cdc46/Mcm family)